MLAFPKIFGDSNNEIFIRESYISGGAFGSVYSCRSQKTHETFAVKVEDSKRSNTLFREWVTLQLLGGTNGIPKVKWFGTLSNFNTLVMERLGDSVSVIRRHSNDFKLPLEVTLNIGLECISILESIHSKGFVHCDVKPSNLVFGRTPLNHKKVYLIDFGCARSFKSGSESLECQYIHKFIGTVLFASTTAHERFSQSQRDDLISLGYTLVYLNSGTLPWAYYASQPLTHNDLKMVFNMKKDLKVDSCFKDEPHCIKDYIKYCMKLFHAEVPNYGYLRSLFKNELDKNSELI